jgi:hypothetical protein
MDEGPPIPSSKSFSQSSGNPSAGIMPPGLAYPAIGGGISASSIEDE